MEAISKVIWLDLESTGLDPKENAIVQLAGLVEIDYVVVEEFNFYLSPLEKKVAKEALELTRKTEAEIMAYPHPRIAWAAFSKILDKYVAKFVKTDKFIVGGFNAKFDLDMLHEFARERGEQYLGSYLSATTLDPMHLVAVCQYMGLVDVSMLPNRRLTTLCHHFGIPLDDNAHDAIHDIKATRKLALYLINLLERINETSGTPS